ncbi:MAG TPA: glycosyltransferase family 2 protein [Bacteroidia bacterium]|jgi:glycosyltransferase involved in cell wall biosynthesis|nr:glycosyltransferase family 2 protein [Bacteroidia bacterium]
MPNKISIIVPVYNSAAFLNNLVKAIDLQKNTSGWNLELILIDDGSRDESYAKIEELTKTYNYIKGIKLSRNFGHQIAVKTGLSHCTGDYVAIIDDDLQDPPSLLPGFFSYLDNGYDVAYGVRKKRKESVLKKLSYSGFYRLLKSLSDTEIPLDSGDFCVMKKHVVENMLKLQEKNPFLRGIRAWVGFKQIGVEYERSARVEGESGYTLKKLLKIALDGIFSFSSVPIRTITILGLVGFIFAVVYSIIVVFGYFAHGIAVQGFATLAIIISFFSSLILICLGIIGEYMVRIYDEVRNRPYVIIEKTINI